MLTEHRVDNADEGFVGIEESMSAGQQIALQPTLALMLAQHGIEHSAFRSEEFVRGNDRALPLTAGDLKNCPEKIRDGFVRSKNAEISRQLIELGYSTEKTPQDEHVL